MGASEAKAMDLANTKDKQVNKIGNSDGDAARAKSVAKLDLKTNAEH